VSSVTFSPNGCRVALAGSHQTTTIRDTFTGRIRKVVPESASRDAVIVFSPEGTTFAVVRYPQDGPDTAQFWALERKSPLSGRIDLDGKQVEAISPDGRRFAAIDMREENRVFLCDGQNGRRLWVSADPALILGSKPSLALLERLRQDYEAYGLPTVPKSAYPAYITDRTSAPQFQEKYLALVVPPAQPGGETFYYKGLRREKLYEEINVQAVAPAQALLNGTKSFEDVYGSSSAFSDVVIAIQMQERGWTPLALQFLGRGLTGYRGDARRGLAEVAWKYWEQTLVQPDTDRRISLSALSRLAQTDLLNGMGAKRVFLKDLEASLAPGQGAPGSIEAEIDSLVDYYENNVDHAHGFTNRPELSKAYPAYRKLWLQGFEAVPVLLKHTEDRRLTRMYQPGIMNSDPYFIRISEIVADLLAGLAGSAEAVGIQWRYPWPGPRADRAKAELWWKQASAIGEEAYLLKHVLPSRNSPGSWPNPNNAVLIAVRYPQQLPALYREALSRYPNAQNWQLMELVQESSLSDADKTSLLIQGETSSDQSQRLYALRLLVGMKRPEVVTVVVERLSHLPATPPGPYSECEAAGLARIVQALDDPRSWNALEQLARRSDVGQRLEIVAHIGDVSAGEARKRHQVEFLEKFVQDHGVRIASHPGQTRSHPEDRKYEGSYADADIDPITVQDAALRPISYLIGTKEHPDATWKKEDWDQWRQTVLQALKAYLASSQAAPAKP
jgi:hypothetical protein